MRSATLLARVGPPDEADLAGFSDWLLSVTAMESIHAMTPNLDLYVALAEERLRRARLDPEGNFEPEQAESDLLSTLRFARKNDQLVSRRGDFRSRRRC